MDVVVGVNDSTAARRALCWAYGFARRFETRLTVVTVYSPTTALAAVGGYAIAEPQVVETSTRSVQARIVRDELGSDAHDQRIDCLVVPGDPATALVALASTAELLVVGRRAERWHRLLHGSTSSRCANRSSCPVVIVRASRVPSDLHVLTARRSGHGDTGARHAWQS